jgi:hypothetical protein
MRPISLPPLPYSGEGHTELLGQPVGRCQHIAFGLPAELAGFTLYGTIDMGAGYNIAGIPFGNSFGISYGIRRASDGARFSLFPNALSTSVVGLKMEEQIFEDWLLICVAEFGFSPQSGMFINGPRRLADNNLNPQANQAAHGDSSRAE